MWLWIKRFLREWVAPFYYLFILIGAVLAAINLMFAYGRPLLIPAADNIYEWWTGVEIAPSILQIPAPLRVGISAVLNFLVILLLVAVWQIFRTRRRWRRVVGEIRNCVELHLAFREKITKMKASSSSLVRAQISETAREHVIVLCTRISEIFEHLLRAKCHTSVKSFSRETGLVATRARDAQAHNAERVQADEAIASYRFDANTAFERIISDQDSYMYVCNHLRLAHACGKYKNRNDAWREFYTATFVVPITLKRNKREIHEQTVIGFLCVDTLRGKFRAKNARSILLVFVVMLHDVMLLLGTSTGLNVGTSDARI
jgi:hypothetical protein